MSFSQPCNACALGCSKDGGRVTDCGVQTWRTLCCFITARGSRSSCMQPDKFNSCRLDSFPTDAGRQLRLLQPCSRKHSSVPTRAAAGRFVMGLLDRSRTRNLGKCMPSIECLLKHWHHQPLLRPTVNIRNHGPLPAQDKCCERGGSVGGLAMMMGPPCQLFIYIDSLDSLQRSKLGPPFRLFRVSGFHICSTFCSLRTHDCPKALVCCPSPLAH
jgi:hypothetical protein